MWPPPLCGKHRAHRVFLHFSTSFCRAGTGCGDASFGLIRFRCETHAARARALAGRKRRTQAGAHASCACGFAARACLGGRVVCGFAGRWGGMRGQPAGESRLEALRSSGSTSRSRLNRVLLSVPISPVRPASAAGDGEAL